MNINWFVIYKVTMNKKYRFYDIVNPVLNLTLNGKHLFQMRLDFYSIEKIAYFKISHIENGYIFIYRKSILKKYPISKYGREILGKNRIELECSFVSLFEEIDYSIKKGKYSESDKFIQGKTKKDYEKCKRNIK
jgi:hypothetical protein